VVQASVDGTRPGRRAKFGVIAVVALFALAAQGATASAARSHVSLSFTTAPQTMTAGATSAAMTVQLSGAVGPVAVALTSSASTGVFRDAADTTTITSVTIPAGQTSASFRYRDTAAGNPSVTAAGTAQAGQFTGTQSARQTETVKPSAPSALSLAPASSTIKAGGSVTYTASTADQYGNTVANVTGQTAFSVAPDGTCTGSTCTASLAGTHTVTGTSAGMTGTASLSVTGGNVARLGITPDPASVVTGQAQSYTVTAYDNRNRSLGDVTPAAAFTIAPDGTCNGSACTSSQPGLHTVTATYSGKTASASLAVTSDCRSSGPGSGAYTVTVCLSPGSGASVSGNSQVTATVSVQGTDPHTAKVIFYLDGQYLITDFQTPYTFVLPSARWVDGVHNLQAQAIERDGFVADEPLVSLTFSNGVSSPPGSSNGFHPTSGRAPGSGPFVLAAVGDGAGGETGEASVTSLIGGWNPNLFLYLGDVYEKGTPTEFLNWYGAPGGPYFGQFAAITDPTVGNHEYTGGVAPGYFDYWNNPPDYYSVNTPAGWHLVSLNSNLSGAVGSAQYTWLSQDLANDAQPCTLVFFHHPLFNIGPEPVPARFADIWPLLAQDHVNIVLNGHDHDYQRWVPMDGTGKPDPNGVTEFVVGTGGHSLQSFVSTDSRVANSLSGSFGALRLDLSAGGASYRYVTAGGSTADSGSLACSSAADTQPPSVPANLTATTVAPTHVTTGSVDLSWDASTDNVGVAGYDIFRDGSKIASVGVQTTYSDTAIQPQTTYDYQVRAVDGAGNTSSLSSDVSVTTPAIAPVFSDGFESGDFSAWDSATGLTTEQSDVASGSWAAEANTTGAATYALKTLDTAQSSLYYRMSFKIVTMPVGSTVYLGRFRTAPANGALLGFYVSSTGKLGFRNDVTGSSTTSSTAVTPGVWHTVEVHVVIADTASQVETWLDGAPVAALTNTQSLGTTPVGRIQLGDNSGARTYDVLFDDVAADTVILP
jgi:Calcineurin-like phosphoesterase/Bacterial Ig domain